MAREAERRREGTEGLGHHIGRAQDMDVVRIGEHHPPGAKEALQAAEEGMLAERVQLRAERAALPRAATREQHMGWHAAAPPEVELCGRVVHA